MTHKLLDSFFCSNIIDIDFDEIRTCIERESCHDMSAIETSADASHLPKLTFINVIELLEGYCKPGAAT